MPANKNPIPPLAGERISTKDGDGYVIESFSFSDEEDLQDREFRNRLSAKIGMDYESKYFRVVVELIESRNVKSYHSWEVEYDADRDVEKAPWR